MTFRRVLALGLLLAATGTAADASPATYRRGILTCPDGSTGRYTPTSIPPSARQLDNACSMRMVAKPKPFFSHPQPYEDREKLRADAAKLIGTPK